MTTVGKLLVFMNLVFSLVVGAFAVMDYSARTHWADGYNKVKAQYEVAATPAALFKAEADGLRRQQAELNDKLATSGDPDLKVARPEDSAKVATRAAGLLNERAQTIDSLKKQLAAKSQEVADKSAALLRAGSATKVAVTDVGRSQEDTGKLIAQLKEERVRNDSLVLEKNKLRDDKTAAEIDRNAFKARSEQLAQDNVRLEKMVTTMRAAGGNPAALAKGGQLNPLPKSVEGLVTKADQNLVTISIGSDAGLQKGHHLEVFRLGANPKYVGKIRIVDVTPGAAVGQAEGRTNGVMQVNDRVGTSITGAN